MSAQQKKRLLRNTNRVIIATLSLGGMLLDGCQLADLMLGMAVTLWLWMPECQSLELVVLDRVSHQNDRLRHER